jgi:hypothetical protein
VFYSCCTDFRVYCCCTGSWSVGLLYASLTECIIEVASFVKTEVVQDFLCVTNTRFVLFA